MHRHARLALLAVSAASLSPWQSDASAAQRAMRRQPDIADMVAGHYSGAVIADTRGGSHSDVAVTVIRVAKNVVSVGSDYPRIPTTRVTLTRASDAIIAVGAASTFLIELRKDPRRLDLSMDGVTWMGHKD